MIEHLKQRYQYLIRLWKQFAKRWEPIVLGVIMTVIGRRNRAQDKGYTLYLTLRRTKANEETLRTNTGEPKGH